MPALRASDVFRIRRHQPTRLEDFVGSAFAFAVTFDGLINYVAPSIRHSYLQCIAAISPT